MREAASCGRRPVLIVVTGLPCAGKTTLARRLGQMLSLPVMTKVGYDGLCQHIVTLWQES